MTPTPEAPLAEKVPTATHPTLEAACDSMASLVRRVLRQQPSRRNGAIDFGFEGTARQGCELTTSGSFPAEPPAPADSTGMVETDVGRVERALGQAGWVNLLSYQADGPDGQDEGWRSRETTCVLRWSWDGGDDGDSTYVASNEWRLAVDCAPWQAEDSERG